MALASPPCGDMPSPRRIGRRDGRQRYRCRIASGMTACCARSMARR